jgi:4'-phosphopantetheinyl transferase
MLNSNDVHIWTITLDNPPLPITELTSFLSEDEQKKSDRYKFDTDRNKFIICRGMLRMILSKYINTDPKSLNFEYTDKGKPSLTNSELSFNLSHAENLAVYGITMNKNIGIDIEYLQKKSSFEDIAKRFFLPQEYAQIKQLPEQDKSRAFFYIWTGKEAYFKATGEGISAGLDQIEISLNDQEKPEIIKIKNDREITTNWQIFNLKLPPDYIGKIVVKSTDNLNIEYI